MISTIDRPLYQHLIGDVRVIELRDLPDGRTWAAQPEDGYILIRADLTGEARTRALGEALEQLLHALD